MVEIHKLNEELSQQLLIKVEQTKKLEEEIELLKRKTAATQKFLDKLTVAKEELDKECRSQKAAYEKLSAELADS